MNQLKLDWGRCYQPGEQMGFDFVLKDTSFPIKPKEENLLTTNSTLPNQVLGFADSSGITSSFYIRGNVDTNVVLHVIPKKNLFQRMIFKLLGIK